MKRRFNKQFLLLLIPATAALALWLYPKDLDLSHVKSNAIKNEKGQPAQLLWWRPSEEPFTVFHFTKEEREEWKAKGVLTKAEIEAKAGEEWYSRYASDWMIGGWFKVAEIGNRRDGLVKVYLLSKPAANRSPYRFFLAKPQDLSKTRSLWQPPPPVEE